MKAVRFHEIGGPEVLVYEDIAEPVPGPGEVLIKIEAVGMNFADVMRRRGDAYPEPTPTPFVLGAEVAGTIAAVGEGVTGVPIGLPVLALPGAGGYAQYIAVPAASIIPLPEGFDAINGAALLGQALSAAILLKHSAKIRPGETVLIEGAAGGVGSFAIQLAKLYGAGTVIAAASTAEKRAAAEALGADASVDYTKAGWAQDVKAVTEGRGVDVVIEIAGGQILGQAIDALASFGRLVVVGQASGEAAAIDPWRLVKGNQSMTGYYLGGYLADPEIAATTAAELLGYVASAQLTIHVGKILPLSQAVDAHRLLEGRQTTGKVVLQPWVNA